MTDKKPEALRLADLIEAAVEVGRYSVGGAADCAAAELRRLHEVVQRLLRERSINLESAQRDTARIAELEKQRDELLEALKGISEASPKADHKKLARAAIAKVKGEKQ